MMFLGFCASPVTLSSVLASCTGCFQGVAETATSCSRLSKPCPAKSGLLLPVSSREGSHWPGLGHLIALAPPDSPHINQMV